MLKPYKVQEQEYIYKECDEILDSKVILILTYHSILLGERFGRVCIAQIR